MVEGQAVGMKITYQMVWRGPEEAGSLKSNMEKGEELLMAGQKELAIIRFKQALEIKPNNKEAEEKLKACLGN
jgi:Flp pilus assembly protein TadD